MGFFLTKLHFVITFENCSAFLYLKNKKSYKINEIVTICNYQMKLDKLDKIDKELLGLLYEDGRVKLTELGQKMKNIKGSTLSHVAVQKRLQKLQEKMIKIQANLNINAMEYTSAFILIETQDYATQRRIIERFRLCPRVGFMDLTSGKYNIIIRAHAPSLKELEFFINKGLKAEEGIRNIETYISSTNVKPRYMPIPLNTSIKKSDKRAPCGASCFFCDYYKNGECSGCRATKFCDHKYNDFLSKE